jgi:hypothetical protein
VFLSRIGSLGTWNQLGTGLPNAHVERLNYGAASNLLVAGTLGRGAWSISDPLGGPTPAPTNTPTPTPTGTPTPKPTPTPIPVPPFISSIPKMVLVGSEFVINGSHFAPGSVVNFFVSTSNGARKAGTFKPQKPHSSTMMTVAVPDTVSLGQGFASVTVVNTDIATFPSSNTAFALLQGNPLAGIPTITAINGVSLDATSSDPRFAANNVKTVVAQGSVVKLGGMGFDAVNGVAVNLFCACKGGKVGPFPVNPGPELTASSASFTLPSSGAKAPPTGPGSFVVINKGADGKFSKSSNAVSVPIGEKVSVTSVTQPTSTSAITVDGTGFSTLTVINLFNTQGGKVVNLGGQAGGVAKIRLTIASASKFTFARPAGAVPGASYVQALNPPFVPFTSSGNAPGGAFTLK